ncbi:MAG: methionyl-tRNA formyltransferase [Stellaceae bacterium]
MKLRLAFMGTADFAVPSLAALIAAGHDIVAVYSQPARPWGPGHRPRPSPVVALAAAHDIPIRTPDRLGPGEIAEFAALPLDAAVVAAYGLLLPRGILETPRLGAINVHASLLPRWRGAAPIERAILAGDAETGITIMKMDQGLDTGPILLQDPVPIGPRMIAAELHDLLAFRGAELLTNALDAFAQGSIVPRPQPADGATYAKKLDRAEGAIDWRKPAIEIDRLVRALNPRLPTWFLHEGERLKLLAAVPVAGEGAPGTVLDTAPTIACGTGALWLLRLQREGRAAQGAAEFLRGHPLPPGTCLSCPATD